MAEEKKKVVRKKEVTLILPAIHAPSWLQGFVDFIREQGVVGLAVGLTLGIASKGVVDSIVNNILTPIISVLSGGERLGSRYACLSDSCANKLGYGQVISDLLSFLLIVAVVYFAVKGLKLDRLDKPKDE